MCGIKFSLIIFIFYIALPVYVFFTKKINKKNVAMEKDGGNLICKLRLPGGIFSLSLSRFGFCIPEIGYIQCFMRLHKSEGSDRFLELPSPAIKGLTVCNAT